MNYINNIQAEWIKTKRTASNWLSLIGGLFIPLITTLAYFHQKITLNTLPKNGWAMHYSSSWEKMAIFLLPMGMILAGSLITQIESKNNTWKQVHATPQSFTNIFFSKFTVILFMSMKFFIYFNIGVLLSGLIPTLALEGSMPTDSFPFWDVLKLNIKIFIACVPILAFQYFLSLRFKNFLVPIGIGLLGLIGTLIGGPWDHIYISPYSYTFYAVMPKETWFNPTIFALISFAVIMIVSLFLYLRSKNKG
ncbi:ABC transporter permease [Crocinitomicaceae bacterium]|nr:ABC transporter permease [Crocinitomicaceae bacterium]